jgi:hypothetical protein
MIADVEVVTHELRAPADVDIIAVTVAPPFNATTGLP